MNIHGNRATCFDESRRQHDAFLHHAQRVVVALAVCAGSIIGSVHAQVTNCGFDVSRDVVANTAPKTPSAALDGVLLTRFALGIRGPDLYDRLSTDATRFVGEGNIGSLARRLDVDGDGVFTEVDATAAARYIAGFRGDALAMGLTMNSAAARKTGSAISTFISGGCVPDAPTANAQRHAARLLQQGTFGVTLNEINRVALFGSTPNAITNAWLNEQFNKTGSTYGNYAKQIIAENKTASFSWRCDQPDNGCPWGANTPTFFKAAMSGDDQLRQRVTNALWQTLVVSISNNTVLDAGTALPSYWDMLSENVFAGNTTNAAGQSVGNFRKILKDMTLHPAMGIFLDMLGSTQEVPNENYPRELLQLFSVGTVMLNIDGSPMLSGGKTIPTYNEDVVKGFSKALTGWHYDGADSGTENQTWWFYYYPNRDHTKAMKPWSLRRCPQDARWPPGTTDGWCDTKLASQSYPAPHNREAKMLLQYSGAPYATIPASPQPPLNAGETHRTQRVRDEVAATALADLEKVIDNVFYHPNVGPFISRQLIQRLVTSNPSPAYIRRVAEVFNDSNGAASGGVRGDMKEVVKAIFLDDEARNINTAAQPWFGKLREPVVKFIHMHRAFGASSSDGYYDAWDMSSPETLGQGAMRPPSVFNYYSPDFGPSGPLTYSMTRPIENAALGARSSEPLLAPEFEITSTSTIAGFSDFWNWGVFDGYLMRGDRPQMRWVPDYSRYVTGTGALADNPQAMVDELDLLLTAGNLKPAFKANLVDMATKIKRTLPPNYTAPDLPTERNHRFRAVYWQIVNSSDYAIQR